MQGEVELTAFTTHCFLPRSPLTDTPFHLPHLVHPPRATCGQIRDALCHAQKEAFQARGGLEVSFQWRAYAQGLPKGLSYVVHGRAIVSLR